MSETKRIRWHTADDGETTGYVGSLDRPVFRIWPPDDDGDCLLFLYLVGHAGDLYHGATIDGQQAQAERLLGEFVSSLGAVFPDESPMVCTACRRPVRKVPGIWAPSVWEHAETEDGRACPDLGAHLTGVPIMAMVAPGPETSAPRAGEKEADR